VPVGSSTARKLVMPSGAVLRRGELTAAYVLGADGRPQLRQIRVGERVAAPDGTSEGLIEVLAGLADGERVALDPRAASGRVR
jgi:membrane fusion protein, multidrug efflux system